MKNNQKCSQAISHLSWQYCDKCKRPTNQTQYDGCLECARKTDQIDKIKNTNE